MSWTRYKFGISFLRIFTIFFLMRLVTKFMKILTTKFKIRWTNNSLSEEKKRFKQSRALTWLIQASLKTSRFSCATLLLGLEAKILAALMTCEQKIGGLGQDWKSILCHGRFSRSKLWTGWTVNNAVLWRKMPWQHIMC